MGTLIIGAVGVVLIALGIILGVISIIEMMEEEWKSAIISLILAILCEGIGVWFIKSDEKNYGQEDDEYVTVVTSDYKVLDQSQMYITDGDTVVYKKYIIKYKK